IAAKLLAHLECDPMHLGDFVAKMNRQSDCLALIRKSTFDRLSDPPRGVGADLRALGWLESIDCCHQPDVSFGNKVKKRQTTIHVVLCDGDHEAQVRIDHEGAGLAIAVSDFSCELNFLFPCQKGDSSDLAEVNLHCGIFSFGIHMGFLLSGSST